MRKNIKSIYEILKCALYKIISCVKLYQIHGYKYFDHI